MDTSDQLTALIEELKVETSEIDNLLNRIPVGIYRSRLDGSIVYANKYFRDLFEIRGNIIAAKELSYNRKDFFELVSKCGLIDDFTATVILPSGKTLHTIESARAIYNVKGEIEFVEGILTDITKFKTVQDALAESEEKYRLLFERSDDPILLIDGDRWVDCNDAALKILGLRDKSEIIGRRLYDISPETQPDNRSSKDKAMEYIREAYHNGYKRFDWVHTTGDGRNIFVDVSLTAIPYRKRILLFTYFRDISARIESERKLRENEEKFRLVFHNISDGIFLIDQSGTVLDVNRAVENITGYNSSEIVGEKIWDFSNKIVLNENFKNNDDKFNLNLLELKANPSHQQKEGELIIRKKDGKISYVNLTRLLINSSQGVLICSIIRDITEIKNTTSELILQKELYQGLVQTLPISVYVLDLNGNILYANDDAYKYFSELDFDFSTIKSVFDLINESDYERLKDALKLTIKQGYIRHFEIESRPINGKIIEVEINASVIYDTMGNPQSIITSIVDIGARKQTERIREQALLATIEAAKARSEALEIIHNSARLASIGVVAGGIVHEISQPLNAIRIGAESILTWDKANKNPLPSPIINMIQGISKATLRIDDIIQHMRSLWLNSNTETLEIVDLNDCIKSAINLSKMRVQSHEIIFETSFTKERLPIKANKIHIELIVNNLITNSVNALDSCEKPNKTIRIATKSTGGYAYMIVYDNGIGLPDVKEEKLFDPFFSTRQSADGTGVGLAIVKMFVDKYKGSIQPMNNEDGGATFIINFPICKGDQYE